MHDITNMVNSSRTWRISSLTCQRDKLLYNTKFLLIVLVQLYPLTNIYKIGKRRSWESWCPTLNKKKWSSHKMFCVKVYCLHYLEVQLVCNGCPQRCWLWTLYYVSCHKEILAWETDQCCIFQMRWWYLQRRKQRRKSLSPRRKTMLTWALVSLIKSCSPNTCK